MATNAAVAKLNSTAYQVRYSTGYAPDSSMQLGCRHNTQLFSGQYTEIQITHALNNH